MKAVKTILAILAAVPSLALAESDYEAVVDDSVIGYWRFNDPSDYNKDASGHGGDITEMKNNAAGGPVAESVDWSRGGGCLELPCSNTRSPSSANCGSAVATLTSGKTLDMSRTEGGWTVATWIRGSQALVDAFGSSGSFGGDMDRFKTALGDGKWHPLVVVYRPGSEDKNFYHVYVDAFDGTSVADITAGGNDSKGHPAWHIPLTVSNDKVTLGGDIGGSYKVFSKTYTINATFFGGLDDCVVLDRELDGGSKGNNAEQEVFRFVRTGETFVYSRGQSGDMFVGTENWSNKLPPQPGLAYIIENGYEVRSTTTARFAGKSLSIGRTEKLYGIKSVGGSKEVIVDNTVGKLLQSTADTTMTVDDLILNDGVLTSKASRQSLVANIRVRAPSSNPFQIAVTNAYTVSGKMLGTGSVAKVGPGTLDLSGLTESTAKVSLLSGKLRLPAVNPTLSGYVDGTLLVDFDENAGTATTVAVESSWSGKLRFKLNGTVSKFGRYAAISVPKSVMTVTESNFHNQTECESGMTVQMRVVATGALQTVYVECVPAGDRDGSPILGFE